MAESETDSTVQEEFKFDEWASELNLSRKVCQTLRQEELTSKATLILVQESDLKSLGLPLGAIKTILCATNKWKDIVSVDDKVVKENAEATDILSGAGKTLDALLNNMTVTPGEQHVPCKERSSDSPYMDPRTILTMKAQSKKAVHITQFLTEKTKRRRQNRRKEYVLHSGQSSQDTLVLRTADDHPYLGIFIEEWGAANMRVMNNLLSTGQLNRQDIEYYLAYTTKIFEFAENHEWNSVLNFDFNYRELQAEHGFSWGTFSPHMEMQTLIPKRLRTPTQTPVSFNPKEECRIFKARGSCPFGQKCRYSHKRQVSPSEDQAAQKNM